MLSGDKSAIADDFNLYAYVYNDPLNRADPSGTNGCSLENCGVGQDSLPQGLVNFSAGLGDVALSLVSLGTLDGQEIRTVLMNDAGSVDTASGAYTGGFATGVLASAGLGRITTAGSGPTKTVSISRSKYPESAAHIEQAQKAGKPSVLTVDREGAAARRAESLKGTSTTPGKDRDEYPPAMFKEGGADASVKSINSSDNRGAGASMGNQCRSVPNGGKVQITTCP